MVEELLVQNHGTGGYGTYQSLLLLERLFAEADRADTAERDLFGEGVSPNRLPRKLADLERRQALLEQALAAAKAKDKKRACAPGGDALKAKEAADGGTGGKKGKKPRAPRVPVA